MAAGSIISSIAQDADKDVGLTALTNYWNNQKEANAAKGLSDTTEAQYQQFLNMLNEYQNSKVTPDASSVSNYYTELSSYNPYENVVDASATNFDFTSRNK